MMKPAAAGRWLAGGQAADERRLLVGVNRTTTRSTLHPAKLPVVASFVAAPPTGCAAGWL
jgi:hypothetical protein